MSPDLEVAAVPQQSHLLGRQMVHDSRSRAFPLMAPGEVDRPAWRDRMVRVYDPRPNPEQVVGCCTGVAKCVQFNAVGNRVAGVVLGMADAERLYSAASALDPFPGSWPPEDTGSSGLASARVARSEGLGGEYRWLFGGADEVVSAVCSGLVVSVGTWWHADMFGPSGGAFDGRPVVTPTGGLAGGHQWAARGYDLSRDLVLGRCWWGDFQEFWVSRAHLDDLLRDGGDAHVQDRVLPGQG
jgi:hypothetical protein